MPTIDPYVPAIIKKVPETTTKTLKVTMRYHLVVGLRLPAVQLSYSHMQPMGWNDMSVPRRAPMRETRPPKTGMAEAMMYAITAQPKVQPIQVAWQASERNSFGVDAEGKEERG